MALPRRRRAVRLRAERLGAVRVRGRGQGADEGRQLLLPAAAHPPPRARALEGPRDDRDRRAGEVQDVRFPATRSQKVTGPSFTSLTCISAPKRPVCRWGIKALEFFTNSANSRSPS